MTEVVTREECVLTTDVKEEKSKPQNITTYLNLNLWCWQHKTRDQESATKDNFCELTRFMKRNASTLERVDVGAELWERFDSDQVEEVLQSLGEMPNLKCMNFSLGGHLNADPKTRASKRLSLKLLATVVSKAMKMEYLIFQDVELAGALPEWKAFTGYLRQHSSLMHFRLENYTFIDPNVDLKSLLIALSSIKTLRVLEVFNNYNQSNHDQASTSDMANPSTPRSSLDQSMEALIPPEVLQCLFASTASLKIVRLSGLGIGDGHIFDVAKSLGKNKTVKELLLWKSMITEKGAKILSEAMSNNVTLEVINLNDNPFLGTEGCQVIFESLRHRKDLCPIRKLYIGCQRMDKACQRAMLDLIAENQSLRTLEVSYMWPGRETVDGLGEFARRLRKALQGPQQALEHLHLYYDHPRDSSGEPTTDDPALSWQIFWQKPHQGDGDDDDDDDDDGGDDDEFGDDERPTKRLKNDV